MEKFHQVSTNGDGRASFAEWFVCDEPLRAELPSRARAIVSLCECTSRVKHCRPRGVKHWHMKITFHENHIGRTRARARGSIFLLHSIWVCNCF